jgi:NTE family protein
MSEQAESVKYPPQSPVSFLPSDANSTGPELGIALCLSGGGYRAMVFHLGALIRLNEAGLLPQIKRVSSVSGGSITAAVLGLRWKALGWSGGGVGSRLVEEVVAPIRALASKTIDAESIIIGMLTPGTISEKVAAAYEEHLFHGATLQDLPSDNEGPRFVINATNIQSGALWRFSKPYMADYLVGQVLNPTVKVSLAVAASSAFPPVLSPATLNLDHSDFVPDPKCPLQEPPYTTEVILSDGGVYDNLGIETAWKRYRTVLVSDGGGKMEPEPEPKRDWGRHSYRVLNVIDNQVRSLRKRQLIDAFINPADKHDGTYWGIRTQIGDYQLADALPCDLKRTEELASIRTRLKRLEPALQDRLINWGYAVCDAALRMHCVQTMAKHAVNVGQTPSFPYAGGV